MRPVTVSGQLTRTIAAPQVAMYFAPLLPDLGQEVLIPETMDFTCFDSFNSWEGIAAIITAFRPSALCTLIIMVYGART